MLILTMDNFSWNVWFGLLVVVVILLVVKQLQAQCEVKKKRNVKKKHTKEYHIHKEGWQLELSKCHLFP